MSAPHPVRPTTSCAYFSRAEVRRSKSWSCARIIVGGQSPFGGGQSPSRDDLTRNGDCPPPNGDCPPYDKSPHVRRAPSPAFAKAAAGKPPATPGARALDGDRDCPAGGARPL